MFKALATKTFNFLMLYGSMIVLLGLATSVYFNCIGMAIALVTIKVFTDLFFNNIFAHQVFMFPDYSGMGKQISVIVNRHTGVVEKHSITLSTEAAPVASEEPELI